MRLIQPRLKRVSSTIPFTWASLGTIATVALVLAIAFSGSARTVFSAPSQANPRSRSEGQNNATPVPSGSTQTATADSPETNGLGVPTEAPPDPVTAAIDQLLAPEEGIFGVVLMDPDGEVDYSRNAGAPFVSASLYKLILMADICRAVNDGILSLDMGLYVDASYFSEFDGTDSYFDPSFAGYDTTIEEALLATGAYSSNVAAHALLTLTSTEELNATAADLGLTETYLFTDPETTANWPPDEGDGLSKKDAKIVKELILSYATDGQVNLTTPRDMARYFQLLLSGEIFNESVSTMILEILEQQQVDNRFPALLPADTRMVHKTGNLDFVVHDVGVIYSPKGTKILVAMVEAPGDDARATAVVQRLALIAYGTLEIPPMPPMATPVGDGTGFDAVATAASGTPEARMTGDSATETPT